MSIVQKLIDASVGRLVWRVQDKDDKSYFIEFESWEEQQARKWWFEYQHTETYSNCELAKVRVYSTSDLLMQDSAQMLEFFFNQMQVASCKMDGEHHYRIRGGGPMGHMIGNGPEAAIRAAMAEVRRSKDESEQR